MEMPCLRAVACKVPLAMEHEQQPVAYSMPGRQPRQPREGPDAFYGRDLCGWRGGDASNRDEQALVS